MDNCYWWRRYPPDTKEPDVYHITERVETGESPGGSECDVYMGLCGDICPMYTVGYTPIGYGPSSGSFTVAEELGLSLCKKCEEQLDLKERHSVARRKFSMEPVYIVVKKGDQKPTEAMIVAVIKHVVEAGKLPQPPENIRVVSLCDPEMNSGELDTKFLSRMGRVVLHYCPDLKPHFNVVDDDGIEFQDIKIESAEIESDFGLFRVLHIQALG